MAEPIEIPFGLWPWVGRRKHVLHGVLMGDTWRIRLSRPSAAARQACDRIGSRPNDHYFRSVCLTVCLCRVFLSRLWSDFDQTRIYVICLGL